MVENINLENEFDIKKILNGAATLIQSKFRSYIIQKYYNALVHSKYKKQHDFINKNETNLFLKFAFDCLKNNYLIDCTVFVKKCQYKCHAFILALNSNYLKEIVCQYFKKVENNIDANQMLVIDISFVDNFYWRLILNFLYGNDFEIKFEQLKSLLHYSDLLQIPLLSKYCQFILFNRSNQNLHELRSKSRYTNKRSCCSCSSTSSANSEADHRSEINHEIKRISKMFKLFSDLVKTYQNGGINAEELHSKLLKCVNYQKMRSWDLKNCIAMLKNEFLNGKNKSIEKNLIQKFSDLSQYLEDVRCKLYKNTKKKEFIMVNDLNISMT